MFFASLLDVDDSLNIFLEMSFNSVKLNVRLNGAVKGFFKDNIK